MQTAHRRYDSSFPPGAASATVAMRLTDGVDEVPRWKRVAKAIGKAWVEGSLMSDPVAYSLFLRARAEAEAQEPVPTLGRPVGGSLS